jgi:hypothetical protein
VNGKDVDKEVFQENFEKIQKWMEYFSEEMDAQKEALWQTIQNMNSYFHCFSPMMMYSPMMMHNPMMMTPWSMPRSSVCAYPFYR